MTKVTEFVSNKYFVVGFLVGAVLVGCITFYNL